LLYISADNVIECLSEIAIDFSALGGKLLIIDEIHKASNFAQELKIIYDFVDIKVIFSGSSALEIENSKVDLSRRALFYHLHSLSFREFLSIKFQKEFPTYSLDNILANLLEIVGGNFKNKKLLNKPDKIYLENINLYNILCNEQNIGSVRESFFVSQLKINHSIKYSNIGDFSIDDKIIVEIGGKNKSFKQIKDIPNSYVIADDVEIGNGNKIPLWLFGFLY